MARRKVILFLVEGNSDKTALGVILGRLFTTPEIIVEVVGNDITAMTGVQPENILSITGGIVENFVANNKGYGLKDISMIIQLTDTDGAYVPEKAVMEDRSQDDHFYTPTAILTPEPDNVISRNKQKAKNINKLYPKSKLGSAKYRLYYMSCNLDHVLYDKQNNKNKGYDAEEFWQRYADDLDGFVDFISNSDFSVTCEGAEDRYKESWKFIKKDLHSLERHTNFGLCLEELKGSSIS